MTDASVNARVSARGHIWADTVRQSAAQISATARNLSYRTWPYRLSLAGPMPDRVLCYPVDLRPVSGRFAAALMEGRYAFPGGTVAAQPTTAPWRLVPPNDHWAEALHGFAWLRHFEARRDESARQHLHWLVTAWLDNCGGWHDVAWRPHVIARRLISWFSHGRLLLDSGDAIWRSSVLRSMAFQARHLSRTARLAADGDPRLTAAVGLCLSGVCLPDGKRRLERGLQLLKRELERQILGDGGHVTRNPEAQLTTCVDLLALKDALEARKRKVPTFLNDLASRMAPLLRFFRHGDGRLALFNGAMEGEAGAIEAVLARGDAKGRAPQSLPAMGYERLRAGRTLVLVDTGAPPRGAFSTHAHAGCLAFEMSCGRHRLIVNCGSTPSRGEEWLSASRTTAAHSTVALADRSSARFVKRRWLTRLIGPRIAEGPADVESQRLESDAGLWLTASHDGYAGRFHLIHERRLYLNAEGDDLRGEDLLRPPEPGPRRRGPLDRKPNNPAVPFAVRFHLHPDVRASLSRDAALVLLILPNGDGWQFRTNRSSLSLEDSVYLGAADDVRRSRQIVVSGVADPAERTSVKWAIHRLSRKTGGP